MAKKTSNSNRGEFEVQHTERILQAIDKMMERETLDNVLSDTDIYQNLLAQGLYVGKSTVFDLRRAHGLPNSRERRIKLFAKGAN